MKELSIFLLTLLIAFPTNVVNAQTKAKTVRTATTTTTTAPRFGNTDGVTAEQMKAHLTFIASDELEGRDTPSRGLDIAAMYIAQHLKSWGIKPAGDNGSYFQKFPAKRVKLDAQNTRIEIDGQSFALGEDFLSTYNPVNISGSQIVYASHGMIVKSKNINPYQGIDVKDKIIVIEAGEKLPKGVTPEDMRNAENWISAWDYAQANGAKAIIGLANFSNQVYWKETKLNQTEKGSLIFEPSQSPYTIPFITVTPALFSALFSGEKISGYEIHNKAIIQDHVESFDLNANKKININIAAKTENLSTQNVVGILEGSDPVLRNEYVAIGAHYDHVGMNPNAPGEDKIWNGADDDGSGTVAVMALAEAFSKGQRPKRSILFIWHAGEEKGLWGSKYFTEHPAVPISSIIAQLNIDMIGRAQQPNDTNEANKQLPQQNEVFVIGSKMMSSELGEISETVNKSFLNLKFNYKYDDPNDRSRFFYRSDHYNYARKGIPIIFYMDGSHADYHQPSDSIEKIDFAQMEKITRTIFATGWELANRPIRPKIDKPLLSK